MEADPKFESRGAYLYVKVPAATSAEEMCAHAERIAKECEDGGHRKILIDALSTEKVLPIRAYYEAGVRCADMKISHHVKVACVVRQEATYHDRFYESVLRNRGVDYRWFLDAEEARRWLVGS
jgi:hypothetical protein